MILMFSRTPYPEEHRMSRTPLRTHTRLTTRESRKSLGPDFPGSEIERQNIMAIASTHEKPRTYGGSTAERVQPASAPLTWSYVPLVPQVVLVGQRDELPVAVIDQVGSEGFRAGLCNGKSVGIFRTLGECKRAVAAALDAASDS
jgi:hypothetical protein